jgi:hypothetical protein
MQNRMLGNVHVGCSGRHFDDFSQIFKLGESIKINELDARIRFIFSTMWSSSDRWSSIRLLNSRIEVRNAFVSSFFQMRRFLTFVSMGEIRFPISSISIYLFIFPFTEVCPVSNESSRNVPPTISYVEKDLSCRLTVYVDTFVRSVVVYHGVVTSTSRLRVLVRTNVKKDSYSYSTKKEDVVFNLGFATINTSPCSNQHSCLCFKITNRDITDIIVII